MLYLFLTGLGLATAVPSTGLSEGDIPMIEKTLYINDALVEEESDDDQGGLPDIINESVLQQPRASSGLATPLATLLRHPLLPTSGAAAHGSSVSSPARVNQPASLVGKILSQ